MKVLIAEDDPITHKILENTLVGWGYDVLGATDGNQAWEHLRDINAPKLVILDWLMPGLDGPELCRRLRAEKRESYTYILLLTGKTDREDIVRGMEAGADDYIAKPCNPAELRVRLNAGERILALEAELTSVLAQLKEGEELRKTFVATLTHDLRTPLLAEQRTLDLLQYRKTSLDSEGEILLEGLVRNNHDLLDMVNTLLETYQYDHGGIQPVPEAVDLKALVRDCLRGLTALALPKRISLRNTIPDNLPPAQADPVLLKRVLTNLVGNALANIPDERIIEVSATIDATHATIRVADNGQGIEPATLPHLFERYFMGMGNRRKIGSGLGLFICKTIMELHGGAIRVDSLLGRGTCFTLSLPRQVNLLGPEAFGLPNLSRSQTAESLSQPRHRSTESVPSSQ